MRLGLTLEVWSHIFCVGTRANDPGREKFVLLQANCQHLTIKSIFKFPPPPPKFVLLLIFIRTTAIQLEQAKHIEQPEELHITLYTTE